MTTTMDDFCALTPEQMVAQVRHQPSPPAGPLRLARLFLMMGRPRTCVPAWLSYWLGTAYAARSLGVAAMLLGGLLATLTSFAANVHNAYTDLAEDARNLPGRVYLLTQYGYRRLRTSLVVLDVLMLAAAALLGLVFLAYFAVAMVALHQYSFRPLRLKARPFGGLFLFAGVLPVPFLCAWVVGRDGWIVPWVSEPFLVVLVFLFLWFLAKGLFKNVVDYHGDRAAGVRTSATIFRTWRGASRTAAAATLVTFALPAALVAAGYADRRVLVALLFWPIAAVQCRRLVRARTGAEANLVLRHDMTLSIAFLAAILLLQAPSLLNVFAVAVAAVILFGSDALGIDSRRRQDSASPTAADPPQPDRPKTPQQLFDRVAPHYDLMNSLLSAGSDRRWRRTAAAALRLSPRARVLDLASGTGAMARAVLRRNRALGLVVGCELNEAMLRAGRRRSRHHSGGGRLSNVRATAEALPFPDNSFDAATLAFAVDDFEHPPRAAAELRRVLRPGGQLVLLELSVPSNPVLGALYRASLRALDLVGRIPGLAGYRHLRQEIGAYRGAGAVAALLGGAGFRLVRQRRLSLGLATVHVAFAPPAGPVPPPAGPVPG